MSGLREYSLPSDTEFKFLANKGEQTGKLFRDYQFLRKEFNECRKQKKPVDDTKNTNIRNDTELLRKKLQGTLSGQSTEKVRNEIQRMLSILDEIIEWEDSILFLVP